MATSIRLDPETERALELLARSRSVSRSEVVRQAIELLAAQERKAPYDLVANLIGSVQGGSAESLGRDGEALPPAPGGSEDVIL